MDGRLLDISQFICVQMPRGLILTPSSLLISPLLEEVITFGRELVRRNLEEGEGTEERGEEISEEIEEHISPGAREI